LPPDAIASPFTSYEKRETPNCNTIESLVKFLKCSPTNIVKNVLYKVDFANDNTFLVLVSIRSDQEINEVKLTNELSKMTDQYGRTSAVISLSLSDINDQNIWATKSLPLGYISPNLSNDYIAHKTFTRQELQEGLGLESDELNQVLNKLPLTSSYDLPEVRDAITMVCNENSGFFDFDSFIKFTEALKKARKLQLRCPNSLFLKYVDKTAFDLKNFVTGADETNYHVLGANWGTEFPQPELVVDIRKATVGDRAVHDPSQTLQTARGIEAGHIFQLGTKYSQAMGATFTDEQGKEKPLVMGCYGVGVSRLAQSAVEQSYDKDGIIWPVAIAPYEVIIVIPNISDEGQVKAAEKLYQDLNNVGIEALLDDRNERAGVKFKDADLIGIPYRIVTGKSLKEGKVELVTRATKEAQMIHLDEVVNTLKEWIETAKK